MVDDKPRMRKRKVETIRERAEKQQSRPAKPQRVRRAAGTIWTPFKLLGRGIVGVLRPLGFLLWPFKTRPVRFVGRLVSAILLLRYFRNSWRELRLVEWPDRKETTQLTLAVFAFAILFGLLVSVTDYGLDKLFRQLLLK